MPSFCSLLLSHSEVQPYGLPVLLFFFLLLGPHMQHLEVPRLWVEQELHLLAYTTARATQDPSHICDLHRSSQQRWTLCPIKQGQG